MKLELPKSEVLLSDFDAWHYVLNKWYIHNESTETEWNAEEKRYESLNSEEKNEMMYQSWNTIFDITERHGFSENGNYVQAVFWNLDKKYVKSVQFFTAR